MHAGHPQPLGRGRVPWRPGSAAVGARDLVEPDVLDPLPPVVAAFFRSDGTRLVRITARSALMGFLSVTPSARPVPSPVTTPAANGSSSRAATKLKFTASLKPAASSAARIRPGLAPRPARPACPPRSRAASRGWRRSPGCGRPPRSGPPRRVTSTRQLGTAQVAALGVGCALLEPQAGEDALRLGARRRPGPAPRPAGASGGAPRASGAGAGGRRRRRAGPCRRRAPR